MGSVSSLPLLDVVGLGLVCLALPRAGVSLAAAFVLALRARAPTAGALGAPPAPSPLVARGGPASPASLPPLATLAPAKGLAGFGR